ncbi:alpha/beta hydrolase [Paenibacillus sp. NPDC058174]|uniref:alpha/beta hydrolase n=1 Tax=Paenibacillus sp. NPDC058174 TaxID=3346366 RepID=UPI0036D82BE9
MNSIPKSNYNWKRKIFPGFVYSLLFLLLLLLLGIHFPSIPYIGELGTISMSLFSIHLVLAAVMVALLSIWIVKLRGKCQGLIAMVCSLVCVVGFIIPILSILQVAHQNDVPISWANTLKIQIDMGKPDLSKSIRYTTVDDKDLFMDISMPIDSITNDRTPVVLIHGGGFVSGTRNQSPSWTKFYLDRGYVVFDVDYRLASPGYVTWDKAAPDIATAIVWIGQHAKDYGVDMDKLLIAGSSAGGSLALQVAYGINDGTLTAYEPGKLYDPKAVIAVYPAQDMTTIWNEGTHFFGMNGETFLGAYIGGSPLEKPEAYHAINIGEHISIHTPPTLLLVGQNDHLLPYNGQAAFANLLKLNNVPYEFVSIPYNDHFFDAAPGSLGSQISQHAANEFLNTYTK